MTGITGPIDLGAGENDPTIDAGLVTDTPTDDASLGDLVFFDENADGLQSDGEPGVAGVTVNLWTDDDGDGTPDTQVGTTTTDGDGNYVFEGLDPDLTYVVQIVPPAGQGFTSQDQGDDELDSDVDPVSGLSGSDRSGAG